MDQDVNTKEIIVKMRHVLIKETAKQYQLIKQNVNAIYCMKAQIVKTSLLN